MFIFASLISQTKFEHTFCVRQNTFCHSDKVRISLADHISACGNKTQIIIN